MLVNRPQHFARQLTNLANHPQDNMLLRRQQSATIR
jgi:hypothetical protein